MANRDRYKNFEQAMTGLLLGNCAAFIIYLIAAAAGILWLKIIFSFLSLGAAAVGLLLLYTSQELMKPRSLWLSCGFFALICCTLASLILGYPG